MNVDFSNNIIFEDKDVLVCKKEAGMPVQTQKSTQQDMISLLMNYRKMKKEDTYIGLIHRLDQPVEGIMVFAKSKKATEDLSKQIREHMMDKQYYAVLNGILEKKEGTLEDYLLKDGKTNLSKVVSKQTKDAKEARLFYEKIAEKENKTLVKIKLETGRHHQIRVQFSHMGYPLFGDSKYGAEKVEVYMPLALCSYKIGFVHPITKKSMEFELKPEGKGFAEFLEYFS